MVVHSGLKGDLWMTECVEGLYVVVWVVQFRKVTFLCSGRPNVRRDVERLNLVDAKNLS